MTDVDERVQALLDGGLSPETAEVLREEIARSPGAERERAMLEGAIAAVQTSPKLPEGFEARVMARVAVRTPPRRSLWRALLAPRFTGELSWAGLAALASVVAVVGVGGGWLGFRAGQRNLTAVASAPDTVLVRFALKAPEARRVELAGTFNGWGSKGVELASKGGGEWTVALRLPRGRYEYTFVVDGERWLPDPSAQVVDDGFGGQNAVLDL